MEWSCWSCCTKQRGFLEADVTEPTVPKSQATHSKDHDLDFVKWSWSWSPETMWRNLKNSCGRYTSRNFWKIACVALRHVQNYFYNSSNLYYLKLSKPQCSLCFPCEFLCHLLEPRPEITFALVEIMRSSFPQTTSQNNTAISVQEVCPRVERGQRGEGNTWEFRLVQV